MDYNSQPWNYEVIGKSKTVQGAELKFSTSNFSEAEGTYNNFMNRDDVGTVLFCKSRKGVVKGQYEV